MTSDWRSLNTVTLLYDSTSQTAGKLTKVQSPLGDARHFAIAYDGSSRISKVELKNNSTVLAAVTYAYNGTGQLTKVTDPETKTVQYTYNAQGGASQYIDSITDKAGEVTSLNWYFQNDATGAWGAYKIVATAPDGALQTFDRSVSTSIDTATTNDGAADTSKLVQTPLSGDASRTRYRDGYRDASNYDRWDYAYDASRDLTRATRPDSTIEGTYVYTVKGRISTMTDTASASITYDYGSSTALHPSKMTDKRGLDTSLAYAYMRLTKTTTPETGANGYTMAYDSYGQVTSRTNPSSQTATMAYNDFGRITSQTDELNHAAQFEYDLKGNQTRAVDRNGNASTFEYSACGGCGGGGRMTKATDALSNQTTFTYDSNGNRITTTDALSRSISMTYDNMNRVITAVGGGGTSTTTYDKRGQVSTQTDPDGKVTAYYYDFQGQLTRQTDGIGNYVQYTYDSTGQVSTVTDGLSHVTDNDYDASGRLTKTTHADGKVLKYFYDGAGRQTKVGAGASGTIDPTEYFYHGTTGQMTKLEHKDGAVMKLGFMYALTADEALYSWYRVGEGEMISHKVTVNTKRVPPLWAAWQCPWEGWDAGWKVSLYPNHFTEAWQWWWCGRAGWCVVFASDWIPAFAGMTVGREGGRYE